MSTSSILITVALCWVEALFNPNLPEPGSPEVALLYVNANVAPPNAPVCPFCPVLPVLPVCPFCPFCPLSPLVPLVPFDPEVPLEPLDPFKDSNCVHAEPFQNQSSPLNAKYN